MLSNKITKQTREQDHANPFCGIYEHGRYLK